MLSDVGFKSKLFELKTPHLSNRKHLIRIEACAMICRMRALANEFPSLWRFVEGEIGGGEQKG